MRRPIYRSGGEPFQKYYAADDVPMDYAVQSTASGEDDDSMLAVKQQQPTLYVKAKDDSPSSLFTSQNPDAARAREPFEYTPQVPLLERPIRNVRDEVWEADRFEEKHRLHDGTETVRTRTRHFVHRPVPSEPSVWTHPEKLPAWFRGISTSILYGMGVSIVSMLLLQFRSGVAAEANRLLNEALRDQQQAQRAFELNLCHMGPPIDLRDRCTELDLARSNLPSEQFTWFIAASKFSARGFRGFFDELGWTHILLIFLFLVLVLLFRQRSTALQVVRTT